MRFGVDRLDGQTRGGIFAAPGPVVVFDSPIKIGGYACVQGTIPASYNVNVPRGNRGISHYNASSITVPLSGDRQISVSTEVGPGQTPNGPETAGRTEDADIGQ